MKKIRLYLAFTSVFLLAVSTSKISAQSLSFCTTVDNNNNPSDFATTFDIQSSGSYIYAILYAESGRSLNTHHIEFDIYKNGEYSTHIDQTVQPDWTFCYKQIIFYDAGDYKIEAYDMDQYDPLLDEYGTWLCTGYVTIKFQ